MVNDKKKILEAVGYVEPVEEEYLLLDTDADRSISDLCEDAATLLKDKDVLFFRPHSRKIVEVGSIEIDATGEKMASSFIEIAEKRFITLVEKYAKVGYWVKTKFGGDMFVVKSLSPVKASIILSSKIFESSLQQILRIFSAPTPILYNDVLTFPKIGYDKRFSSWRNDNGIEISDMDISIEEGKGIIDQMYSEFCFEKEQDRINAISSLITSFSRGLFKKFNTNTPAIFYLGNREGLGKDYCASIPGLVMDGHFQQDTPICNGGKVDDDELRKKITSAFRSGRTRMHFPNNKGYLNSANIEKLLTDPFWTDRILSKNEESINPNEMDISISGNIPIRYTDDLDRRAIFSNLFYSKENINARNFKRSDLHGWILENRSLILSALYSLVKNWVEKDCPDGSVPFASFPEWARVVGGIMESAGYGSPCIKDVSSKLLTGDADSDEIKELYTLCYEKYPNKPIKKADIISLIKSNGELFSYVDWERKSDQTRFSIRLRKYLGREFRNIKMDIVDESVRSNNQEYIFIKIESGTSGTLAPFAERVYSTEKNIYIGQNVHEVTKVPKEDSDLPFPKEDLTKTSEDQYKVSDVSD